MPEDRGEVTKIDIEIRYPDGSIKNVTFSSHPNENDANHYIISEVEGLLFNIDENGPDLQKFCDEVHSKNNSMWEKVHKGEEYKPAMVVLHNDGTVKYTCGGHHG